MEEKIRMAKIADFLEARNTIMYTYHNFLVEYAKQQMNDASSLDEVIEAIKRIENKTAVFGVLLSQVDLFFGEDEEASRLVSQAKKQLENRSRAVD